MLVFRFGGGVRSEFTDLKGVLGLSFRDLEGILALSFQFWRGS